MPTYAETLVWSVDAHGRTLKAAAEEFARTHWPDGPRKVKEFFRCDDGTACFRTSGGVAWYHVVLDGLATPPVYNVYRR